MTESTQYDPPRLTIGDVTASIPIIQGGMGVGISLAGLASAVARAGGIGVIASVHIGITEKDHHRDPQAANFRALSRQIKKAKEAAPDGIIGVNIMVALQDYEELVRISAEAGADLIISGAGLPLKLPGLIPAGCNTKVVPIVSSYRAAKLICRRWSDHFEHPPDAVIVEGPKAGGHLGFKAEELESAQTVLEKLVPEVIAAVGPYRDRWGRPIPVIAAGGVYTGEDIYRFMRMGAAGVQMGTRFVATHECDASEEFKKAYLAATAEDVTIIRSPVGMPGRALKGKFIEKAKNGGARPRRCIYHCLKSCDPEQTPYCISTALINAQRGNLNAGFVFCGANVWRVDKIMSVQELMDELVDGYRESARTAEMKSQK